MNSGNQPVKTILVVEDDDCIRESLVMVLESEGYHVTAASNGKEALDSLMANQPALVLLDTRMPVMSGSELKREMNIRPELHEIPVFSLSASVEREPAEGLVGFISKPYDIGKLLQTIEPYMQ